MGLLDEIKEQPMTIPVTKNTLLKIIERQGIRDIENVDLVLKNQMITVIGEVKKLGMTIPFSITVKPSYFKDRILSFRIMDMKPVNQKWIKKKILSRKPMVTYSPLGDTITLDINKMAIAKRVPYGNIQAINIHDDKIVVGIGM